MMLYLGDAECRVPAVLEDVEAYGAAGIDVAVIDFRFEPNLGRLEGVIVREVNLQEENTVFVWGAGGTLRAFKKRDVSEQSQGRNQKLNSQVTTLSATT
jgi:hypothetical protein